MNDQTTAPEATDVDTESGTAKVRIRPDLNRYIRDKSGNGKRTHRTDDFIARSLAGKSIDTIKNAASVLGVDYSKWEGLNVGQQRMLIGNKLRHFIERTKTLTEEQVTAVLGEPVAEHTEVAAENAEVAAASEQGEVSPAQAEGDQPDEAATDEPVATGRRSRRK